MNNPVKAFNQGRQARKDRLERACNPYRFGPNRRDDRCLQAWREGWDMEDQDSKVDKRRLMFRSIRDFNMGLPIGAMSPVSKEGCVCVINDQEVQTNAN